MQSLRWGCSRCQTQTTNPRTLCQGSSNALRAQLPLNTFNLPWHSQGTGKKNLCFVCGCKAPFTTMETPSNLKAFQSTALCKLSHTQEHSCPVTPCISSKKLRDAKAQKNGLLRPQGWGRELTGASGTTWRIRSPSLRQGRTQGR